MKARAALHDLNNLDFDGFLSRRCIICANVGCHEGLGFVLTRLSTQGEDREALHGEST